MPLRARSFARLAVGAALAIALWLASDDPSVAQTYPQRTVRIIVPFAPGGTADLMPRIVGDWLSRKWGQPVVIENRPGAGGNVGAEAVFRAEPDGYTLLSSPPPPLVINQNLYPRLGFDPAAFVPVSVMGLIPNALVVSPRKVVAATVADFIADARAYPGKISAATQGNGTTSHLTAAMFQMMAKVRFVLVPYRGSAPALQGLLAGDCDIMFDNLGVSLPLAKGGGLKLLAVGTTRRMASLPNVPTIAETLPVFFLGYLDGHRGATADAARYRQQGQRRHCGGDQVAGSSRAIRRALGGAGRDRSRRLGAIHGRGVRALARRHQGRGRDAGIERASSRLALP
jgi:tripartite-type tricarboxylate transporter receptor subunit TctC